MTQMEMIVLYAGIALLAGLILGLLIKRTPKKVLQEKEELATRAAALEAEKQYLQTDLQRLQQEVDNTALALQEAQKLHTQYSTQLQSAHALLAEVKTAFDEEKKHHLQTRHEAINAENNNHRLRAELRYKDEQLQTQQQQLEQIGNKFENSFAVLAQNILEEKTKVFQSQQENSLNNLLNPLKENIKTFKEEFEARYKTESDDRISLREQIKHMMELNQTLSTQANNLTNALRGQVKQQGNWGEMILESILEYADLQKDLHYFVQHRTTGEEGNALLPDVVIKYPDGRSLVIDSKVSLLHYDQYTNSTDTAAQHDALGQLLNSVYKHIDVLSSKKYQDAVNALDFVMMFVPVEGAYITIMQADRQIWQYAYKKRVLLISPTNLIAAMKLVYDLWKREGINQNAQEVAEKAVKIYEKLAAFVEDFQRIGTHLQKAADVFHDAEKKLQTGKGNVISQASQMKQKLHHNKPIRNLPDEWVEQALSQDETDVPE